MKVLPDTSIWVEFFRGENPFADELERLLTEETVLLCGPIVAELVAGAPPERRPDLSLALGSLPLVALDYAAWRKAGEAAHDLDRLGRAVPLIDLIIGVASVTAEATLWTRDRDFERVRDVLPALELYSA